MNRSEEDKLLRDLLANETIEHVRETSLAAGLRAVGARRRQIRAKRVGFTAFVSLIVILAITWVRPRVKEPATEMTVAGSVGRGIELISDEQLLALFPNRDVALIGAPGNQKLIFLDDVSTQVAGLKNR